MAIASGAALSAVADSAASVAVLAATVAGRTRKGVIIHNNSAEIMYLAYGGTAATATPGGYTYKIPADAHWEMLEPIFQGALWGIWANNSSASISVTELV